MASALYPLVIEYGNVFYSARGNVFYTTIKHYILYVKLNVGPLARGRVRELSFMSDLSFHTVIPFGVDLRMMPFPYTSLHSVDFEMLTSPFAYCY